MTTTDHIVTRDEHSPANRAGVRAFKRGDRVRVRAGEASFCFTGGDEFTVTSVDGLGHLFLDPDPDRTHLRQGGWMPSRFELVVEPTPEPEWTPGDGWRECGDNEPYVSFEGKERLVHMYPDGSSRVDWVKNDPVPPLPTLTAPRPEGEGWVEGMIPFDAPPHGAYEVMTREVYRWAEPPGKPTFWHRRMEEPVPPLPTERWTVIRVTWADAHSSNKTWWVLLDDGWYPIGTDDYDHEDTDPEHLRQSITSFGVLARPVGSES